MFTAKPDDQHQDADNRLNQEMSNSSRSLTLEHGLMRSWTLLLSFSTNFESQRNVGRTGQR